MRIALDTNFLVYAEDINDKTRRDMARDIVVRLPRADTFVPVQVLGELYRVLTRKAHRPPDVARATVLGMCDAFSSIETSVDIMLSAMELAGDHQLHIWDAVVLAAAADANCRLLLSEDMQDGFTWRGLTIANPFAAKRNPLLEAALS